MAFFLLELGTILLLGALVIAAPEPPILSIGGTEEDDHEAFQWNAPIHRSYISSLHIDPS